MQPQEVFTRIATDSLRGSLAAILDALEPLFPASFGLWPLWQVLAGFAVLFSLALATKAVAEYADGTLLSRTQPVSGNPELTVPRNRLSQYAAIDSTAGGAATVRGRDTPSSDSAAPGPASRMCRLLALAAYNTLRTYLALSVVLAFWAYVSGL